MKSKFCVLVVLIIIAAMFMTATTALATRYFNVESVEGNLELVESCTFHLHGKRTCFDGPDLTLTFSQKLKDLITWLEAEARTGNTFLSRPEDGEEYSFEWRMYKDDPDCVIHLKSIGGDFGVADNDPTQPGYDPTQPFTVTFTRAEFELVKLVLKPHPNKPDQTTGAGEWETVATVTLTFTITLLEEP